MSNEAVPVLGVPIDDLTVAQVLERIEEFVEEGRSTGRSHQIVTVNTDFIVTAQHHEDIHAILRNADLAVADGMPIVWTSRAMGRPMKSRVTGADLVPAMVCKAAQHGHRVLFFGGGPGVADRAAELMRTAHPGAVVGTAAADVGPDGETDDLTLAEIAAFGPDIICVALGHPKQERWIRRYADDLGIPVAIGVGGTLDFIAGEKRRAARWIQDSGLEWLYRLVQEPRRLTGRYVKDFRFFLPRVLGQLADTRLRRQVLGPTEASPVGFEVLRFGADTGVVVTLRRRGALDHETAGELATLARRCRNARLELSLVAPDPDAMRSIERLRLDRIIAFLPPDTMDSLERRISVDGSPPEVPGERRRPKHWWRTQGFRDAG